MADFFVKQHDTSRIQNQLKDDNGTPINVTGATVKFIAKAVGGGSPIIGSVGTGACTLIVPATGIVQYKFLTADTAAIGPYNVEWQITFADGTQQTVPNPDYDTLTITADLDGA